MIAQSEFDRYASDYDHALAQGLASTGENKDYFARGRVNWLARCLQRRPEPIASILDYGCGTGSSVPWLTQQFMPMHFVGVDVSRESLRQAIAEHGRNNRTFLHPSEYRTDESLDLAFCNGVFHHIPPPLRGAAVQFIAACLRPGGLFALWENNPWNPGTRYVMSRVPFDREARPLSPPRARRLLREAGFEIQRTDYLFIFPRALKKLRWLEPVLSRLPLGGQYQVLCRKPS